MNMFLLSSLLPSDTVRLKQAVEVLRVLLTVVVRELC